MRRTSVDCCGWGQLGDPRRPEFKWLMAQNMHTSLFSTRHVAQTRPDMYALQNADCLRGRRITMPVDTVAASGLAVLFTKARICSAVVEDTAQSLRYMTAATV